MKKGNYFYAVLVLILLMIPGLYVIFVPGKEFSENEDRELTTAPEFGITAFMDHRTQDTLEAWVRDQFPLRTAFTSLEARAKRTVGYLTIDGIYLGSENQLLEQVTDHEMDDSYFHDNLGYATQFLKQYPEAHRHIMLVPTPGTMLKDLLPGIVPYYDEAPYYDSLMHTGYGIDLRSVFEEEVGRRLYYKTDHHWTTQAAYLGAKQLVRISEIGWFKPRIASGDFYGDLYSRVLDWDLKPDIIQLPEALPEHTVTIGDRQSDSIYDFSYLETRNKYRVYFGGDYDQVRITTSAESGRKLLIFKDSFANAMIPYLLGSYDEICMIDLKYYVGDLKAWVEKENFTDILFVYEMSNFAQDKNLSKLQ